MVEVTSNCLLVSSMCVIPRLGRVHSPAYWTLPCCTYVPKLSAQGRPSGGLVPGLACNWCWSARVGTELNNSSPSCRSWQHWPWRPGPNPSSTTGWPPPYWSRRPCSSRWYWEFYPLLRSFPRRCYRCFVFPSSWSVSRAHCDPGRGLQVQRLRFAKTRSTIDSWHPTWSPPSVLPWRPEPRGARARGTISWRASRTAWYGCRCLSVATVSAPWWSRASSCRRRRAIP